MKVTPPSKKSQSQAELLLKKIRPCLKYLNNCVDKENENKINKMKKDKEVQKFPEYLDRT